MQRDSLDFCRWRVFSSFFPAPVLVGCHAYTTRSEKTSRLAIVLRGTKKKKKKKKKNQKAKQAEQALREKKKGTYVILSWSFWTFQEPLLPFLPLLLAGFPSLTLFLQPLLFPTIQNSTKTHAQTNVKESGTSMQFRLVCLAVDRLTDWPLGLTLRTDPYD